jgi:hypothetical protein
MAELERVMLLHGTNRCRLGINTHQEGSPLIDTAQKFPCSDGNAGKPIPASEHADVAKGEPRDIGVYSEKAKRGGGAEGQAR